MTPRHLDDLFSAAYEDELSPAEQTRFETHMQTCEPCAAAYEEFKAGIAALRELPQARMPHAVHLPSTAPVAERQSRPAIGLSWFNLGLLRRFPATAVAGAVAIVLVIVALHAGGTTNQASTPVAGVANGSTAPQAAGGAGSHGTPATAACTQPTTMTASTPPINFAEETLAADPAEPALHLVLAAPTQVVKAGATVGLYAQLSVPSTSVANPDSTAPTPPSRAVLPCLSIGVADTNQQLAVLQPSRAGLAAPEAQGVSPYPGAPDYEASGPGPMFAFVVPTGLAPGTEIRVTARVPAGYGGFESPPLTAELTLTIG
jgi:hypothetical protein